MLEAYVLVYPDAAEFEKAGMPAILPRSIWVRCKEQYGTAIAGSISTILRIELLLSEGWIMMIIRSIIQKLLPSIDYVSIQSISVERDGLHALINGLSCRVMPRLAQPLPLRVGLWRAETFAANYWSISVPHLTQAAPAPRVAGDTPTLRNPSPPIH